MGEIKILRLNIYIGYFMRGRLWLNGDFKNKIVLWIGIVMYVIFVKINWLIKVVRYCDNIKGELVRKFIKFKWIIKLKMDKDYNIILKNGVNNNVFCVRSIFYFSSLEYFIELLNYDFYGWKWLKR